MAHLGRVATGDEVEKTLEAANLTKDERSEAWHQSVCLATVGYDK